MLMTVQLNGTALKEARKRKGYSRDDLMVGLAMVGLSVSTHTLAVWENGKYTPASIRLLGGIATLLGIGPETLISVAAGDKAAQ